MKEPTQLWPGGPSDSPHSTDPHKPYAYARTTPHTRAYRPTYAGSNTSPEGIDTYAELFEFYERLTHRTVWPKVAAFLRSIGRKHHDHAPHILEDELAAGGLDNLLRRAYLRDSCTRTHEPDVTPAPKAEGVKAARVVPWPEIMAELEADPTIRRPPQPADTSTERVPCQDYSAHRSWHRRDGAGWVCDRCREAVA